MIKNIFRSGLFISFLLMFSGVSFGYGMDCAKPSITAQAGNTATFNFSCKNTTGVTFGSYQIFPINVVDATVTATACTGPVAPGALCAVTGTFLASTTGTYEVDFDDQYGGERHYGIFCNNPEKGCVEAQVTTGSYAVGDYVSSEGGVVFYAPLTGDILIVAMNDAGILQWSPNDNDVTTLDGLYDGFENTINMDNETTNPGGSPAADACLTPFGGHNDWYIPSLDELAMLYDNRGQVDTTLVDNGGNALSNVFYWSSSQYDINFNNTAWVVVFYSGDESVVDKGAQHLVRCVRAF